MHHRQPLNRTASALPGNITRTLLTCGALAGPIYLLVGLGEALTRPGFDLTRHDLSLLSNGPGGWIHLLNFEVTGLLVIAGAVGFRQALRGGTGQRWALVLLGLYGMGLLGSGIFAADPAFGFPPGTPMDAHAISSHGLLHFLCGGLGFLALIAACLVLARRFSQQGERGWTVFSTVTGMVFLAGFIGIAAGSGNRLTVLGFWVAVVLAWVWLSTLSVHLQRRATQERA